MKTGLLLGKFMPLHRGHQAMIHFAAERCDRLIVFLCIDPAEPIPGHWRRIWLEACVEAYPHVELVAETYDPGLYPNTSESSPAVATRWAHWLRTLCPSCTGSDVTVFSSEPYGAYLAQALSAKAETFDPQRRRSPISATMIRQNPWQHWQTMPPWVRLYWVNSVCLVGSESTGKTTLAQHLADHHDAAWVPEAGRNIVEQSPECQWEDLGRIAEAHAHQISDALANPCRRLLVDTDVTVTQSYARYLFDRELILPAWIRAMNRFRHYLYCAADAPFVQDGTRLDIQARADLDTSHRAEFARQKIPISVLHGTDWKQREAEAQHQVSRWFA